MERVRWTINDKKNFVESLFDLFIIDAPWFNIRNIRIQKVVVAIVIINIYMDIIVCHLIKDIVINNSPIKFRVGGALILAIVNINHQKVKLGLVKKFLFKEIMFRVWNLVYERLTRKNNAEEEIPWAIIIIIAPLIDEFIIIMILANVTAIWATDE